MTRISRHRAAALRMFSQQGFKADHDAVSLLAMFLKGGMDPDNMRIMSKQEINESKTEVIDMKFTSTRQRKAVMSKLNPIRGSSYAALQAKHVNLSPTGDIDRDGVKNKDDPQPLDRRKPSPENAAKIIFAKNDKMSNAQKATDLETTEPNTKKVTRPHIAEWKKDIAGKDLQGIDTENFKLANRYVNKDIKK